MFPAKSRDYCHKYQASALTMSLSVHFDQLKILSPTPSIKRRNEPFSGVTKEVPPPPTYFYTKEEF